MADFHPDPTIKSLTWVHEEDPTGQHVYHHSDHEPPTTKVTLTRYQKGDYGWSVECRAEDPVKACEMVEIADHELRWQFVPTAAALPLDGSLSGEGV